jgi:hypothetical protein
VKQGNRDFVPVEIGKEDSMDTVQQKLDRILEDVTQGQLATLTKSNEGAYMVTAMADPAVVVAIEAAQAPDRIVLQALIGTLSTVEAERMARAALVLSAASASQGGPAVGLEEESRALIAIRALPIGITPGDAAEAIARFIAQAVDLKGAIANGSILAMVKGEEAAFDETMIRI